MNIEIKAKPLVFESREYGEYIKAIGCDDEDYRIYSRINSSLDTVYFIKASISRHTEIANMEHLSIDDAIALCNKYNQKQFDNWIKANMAE